jgi:hypothetical protein
MRMPASNVYSQLQTEDERDAYMKRLMVELTHLVDVAHGYYADFLEKSHKAFDAPSWEEAEALHASAMDDIIECQKIYPILLSAVLGNESSVEQVRAAFAKFANGKPN